MNGIQLPLGYEVWGRVITTPPNLKGEVHPWRDFMFERSARKAHYLLQIGCLRDWGYNPEDYGEYSEITCDTQR